MSGRSEVWRWSRSIWLWPVGIENREMTSQGLESRLMALF